MEHQHQLSDENFDDVAAYEQVQRLFMAAVELPVESQFSWVESLTDIHPLIVKQVLAALKADAACGANSEESDGQAPALAETVHGNQGKHKKAAAECFPQSPTTKSLKRSIGAEWELFIGRGSTDLTEWLPSR